MPKGQLPQGDFIDEPPSLMWLSPSAQVMFAVVTMQVRTGGLEKKGLE